MTNLTRQPNWAHLFHIACDLIKQVNSKSEIIDRWTFGGGTAMMLQIDHRESHDVDIFFEDPQYLAFLDPQKNTFKFSIQPTDYKGDGFSSFKFAFEKIGEIDFIAAPALTKSLAIRREIEGEHVLLETIPEIIAKKIHYRGKNIRPRDIFDIAAAGESYRDEIVNALGSYRADVTDALLHMRNLNVDFVNQAIAELAIRDKYVSVASSAFAKTQDILSAV